MELCIMYAFMTKDNRKKKQQKTINQNVINTNKINWFIVSLDHGKKKNLIMYIIYI